MTYLPGAARLSASLRFAFTLLILIDDTRGHFAAPCAPAIEARLRGRSRARLYRITLLGHCCAALLQ